MAKKSQVPTIGADPEVFLTDELELADRAPDDLVIDDPLLLHVADEKGAIIPAVGYIKGTKYEPFTPPDAPAGFGLQEDNVMLEFNIPPCSHERDFANHIEMGMGYLWKHIPKGYGISDKPAHKFTSTQLDSPQAKAIGCAIDFDAYEGGRPRNNHPVLSNLRTCGGHIHIGGDFNCPEFVVALFCDAVLGIILGLNALDTKGAADRKRWYGQAGIYRPTTYGIEYRTPSNLWIHGGYAKKVGMYALRLARWLTETPPAEIRTVFKQIDWGQVREAMNSVKNTPNGNQRVYANIRKAGVNFL